MARIVSFVVLVVILLVIAGLFFQVMADFLLPMFLAVLLVVMFAPMHRWFLARCRGWDRTAAGLTTTAILLIFLVPLLLILFRAAAEGIVIYRSDKLSSIDLHNAADSAVQFGHRLGFQLTADELEQTVKAKIHTWLTPLVLSGTKAVGGFLLGLFVMVISLYYFLADGPAMIQALAQLLPLENRYKTQLIDQFANVARAVVLATVLSAAAQGLLAGAGYYFAGFSSVFLLMVLSMLFAMIPFVGAAGVWVPACLWLYFSEGRTTAAIVLAVYCTGVVSMMDNLIKPAVLRGRSNMHPLLALLSVLGGVQALGPIGIFVGPMAVAFLHALLKMLQTEITAMGTSSEPGRAASSEPGRAAPDPGRHGPALTN